MEIKLATIAKSDIQKGIEKGIITFKRNPLGSGTVCFIGASWFYFGGITAEETEPGEFLRISKTDDIVEEVYSVLESFKKEDETKDEYLYYYCVLKENL